MIDDGPRKPAVGAPAATAPLTPGEMRALVRAALDNLPQVAETWDGPRHNEIGCRTVQGALMTVAMRASI